jgi:hypothetical protein
VAPLHIPVLLKPGCAGLSAACPSPALIVVSVHTPPLMPPLHFFKVSAMFLHSERRRGNEMCWCNSTFLLQNG